MANFFLKLRVSFIQVFSVHATHQHSRSEESGELQKSFT